MSEYAVKVRNTKRFIDQNPSFITLMRGVDVPDGAGGSTETPAPLEPQEMRVVQQARAVATERRNSAGEVVTPTITLVCMPDTDIKRGDEFTWEGLSAEVVWVTDLKYVKHGEVSI